MKKQENKYVTMVLTPYGIKFTEEEYNNQKLTLNVIFFMDVKGRNTYGLHAVSNNIKLTQQFMIIQMESLMEAKRFVVNKMEQKLKEYKENL